MKKRTGLVFVLLLLSLSWTMPVSADAPTMENWHLGAGNGYTSGYWINTTNLQVDKFWIENNSPFNLRLRVMDRDRDVIFQIDSPANSGYMEEDINNFKFQRLPATDPDDPDSVRYPPQVSSIGVDYPD